MRRLTSVECDRFLGFIVKDDSLNKLFPIIIVFPHQFTRECIQCHQDPMRDTLKFRLTARVE